MGEESKHDKPPKHSDHVGDFDSLFWGIESDPLLRNTMTVVLVLDSAPDRAAVLERMERASRLVPGFRHRLVTPPLHLANPRWVVDPDFDLSYHVRWIGAPREKTFASVLEFARASAMSGLDRDRPLWSFTFVDGLENDRSAVVVKLHHVLTDGLGGLGLLPYIVDLTPEPADQGPMPPLPSGEPMDQAELVRDALDTNRARVRDFVRDKGGAALRSAPSLVRRPTSVPPTVIRNVQALGRLLAPPGKPLSPIMTERRGWYRFAAVDGDLRAMRRAAKAHGATANDAFVTAVGYGFARYHEKLGAPVTHLRATMAVNLRKPDDPPFGNRVSGGNFTLPVGTDDPVAHMQSCHELVAKLRDDTRQPLAGAASSIVNSMGRFMPGYVGTMMRRSDLLLSNIPGVDVPLWLGGSEVLATYGFGPGMGTATNATLLSYRGTAHIGLNIDAGSVPDIDLLVESVREGLDAVEALAD